MWVQRCYQRRGYIMMEVQDIFRQPMDDLIRERSSQYLKAWLTMFQALEVKSAREIIEGRQLVGHGNSDDDSMATIDSLDLHEYLVDATDGMEREWEFGDWEAVQTPPRQVEMTDGKAGQQAGLLEQWLRGGDMMEEGSMERDAKDGRNSTTMTKKKKGEHRGQVEKSKETSSNPMGIIDKTRKK